jgi:hypothetical protein
LTRRASCWPVRAYEVGDGSAPGAYRVPQHQHDAIHSATPGNSAWISFPNRPFGPRTLFIASTCRDSCLYCEDGQEIARHLSVTSHQAHRWPVGLETKVFDMHVWKYYRGPAELHGDPGRRTRVSRGATSLTAARSAAQASRLWQIAAYL